MPRSVKPKTARPTRRMVRGREENLPDSMSNAVPSLDAEDIALARLQAQLRRKETMAQAHPGVAVGRAMIRLPSGLLARTKRRAQQEGVPVSEIVQRALETFLR